MGECKVTLSKTNAAHLTYYFLMKRWSLTLNDAKGWTPTSLSHGTETEEKLHLIYRKPSSPEVFYPDSDSSQQHVLREDETQGNYMYFLLLLFEKLSILKLRDFLM